MAYKFQLGEFRASGSLIQEGSITSDGTLKLDGVADAALDVSADSFYFKDGDNLMKSDTMADYATAIAGAGLAATDGVLAVDIDELSALGGAGLHQTQDHFIFSDNGTEKKITFSNLQDAVFADVSGDATVAAGGALTLGAGVVEHGMLADDIISGQANLGGVGVDDADEFMLSDDGTIKAITGANLYGWVFGKVSGDATVAAGGALTIAAAAVHHGMLNDDIISGQDELAHADIADADELMISDAGTVKRVGVDSLRDHFFGVVSGDATIADGGALTIAANAVQTGMVHDDVATELAGNGLSAASGVMAVAVSGAIHIDSDKVSISGSIAGKGLQYDGGVDSISSLKVNADPNSFNVGSDGLTLANGVAGAGIGLALGVLSLDIDELAALSSVGNIHQTDDHFLISDAGTEKKITFSDLEDEIFGNISGDASVAAGGALTIAAGAVEHGMLAEDIISGQAALGGASVAQADLLMLDDGPGTVKKVTFSNFEDSIFGNVSGDATVAAGGALTIAANAIEGSMLNTNAISGQTNMTGDVADADELMISDDGVLKRVDFSVFRDAVFNDVSGDAAIADGGALTIAATAVEGSMLNADVISAQTALASGLAATDELMVSDAGALKRMDISVLGDFLGGGAGITVTSGELSASPAQTSITSIINSSLGKIGTDAAQEYIDFSTANEVHIAVNDAPALVATATGVTVEGNLTVLGTTSTVNSTTINISSSFTFEGPADAHETILTCATPAADTTIQLPEFSSTGTYYMAAFAADPGATGQITATPAELNIMDGGASQSTGVTVDSSADNFVFNDGGVMKQLRAKEVKAYCQGLDIQNIDDSGTCKAGFNYFSSLGGAEACTLPASPAVGDIVYVKAPSNCSATNKITINKAGSQTIDGQTALILESPFAGVSLVYVAANLWSIF